MNIFKAVVLFFVVIPVLAHAEVVDVAGVDYKIRKEAISQKSIDNHEKSGKRLAQFNYNIKYMGMFESEETMDTSADVNQKGLDNHQKALAAQGTVLGLGAASGLGINSFDIGRLAVSFMFSGVQDAAEKIYGMGMYDNVINGTIKIAKWIPNGEPLMSLTKEYAAIKSIIASDCGFRELPKKKITTGYGWAVIKGKCKESGARRNVGVQKVENAPWWTDAHGQGVMFAHTFTVNKRTPEQMRELAARLRSTLGDGWYVMQADTLTNQATGAAEKVYLISKNGVMKAYPLPPEPVFQ